MSVSGSQEKLGNPWVSMGIRKVVWPPAGFAGFLLTAMTTFEQNQALQEWNALNFAGISCRFLFDQNFHVAKTSISGDLKRFLQMFQTTIS